MITGFELDCSRRWANKVTYPGIKYAEEALEKTKKAFRVYNERYKDAELNIIFSNNEEIKFQIMAKNICHILGIDFKNLNNTFWGYKRELLLGIDRNERINSYSFLSILLENADRILEHDYNAKDKSKMLNYYKLSIKADIFNKMQNIFTGNFGCVNFNPDLYGGNPKKFEAIDKLFYIPSEEAVCPYFMLGLVKDGLTTEEDVESVVRPYVVKTALAAIDYNDIFDNQEIIIPSQITIDKRGELIKKIISNKTKIELLRNYRALVLDLQIHHQPTSSPNLNILDDYIRTLQENSQYTK